MADGHEVRVDAGWRMMLTDLRLSVARVLQGAELPADLFERANEHLSVDEYFRLWRSIEVEADDPRLPVVIAEAYAAEGFSPPMFAALCAPDLSVALRRLAVHKRLLSPLRMEVDDAARGVRTTLRYITGTTPAPPGLVASELAFLVRIARTATRARVVPLEVTLPHGTGLAKPLRDYFGTDLLERDAFSVTFSAEDARRPFLTANDAMWELFEPELRRRLSALDRDRSAAERVRAALLECLPAGQASIDGVASRLGMSGRTLQRRLRKEDASYQTILGEVREQLARHYLRETDLPCAEIAFLLGYDEPNSFFRAFREWTGESPDRMRRTLRSDGGAEISA